MNDQLKLITAALQALGVPAPLCPMIVELIKDTAASSAMTGIDGGVRMGYDAATMLLKGRGFDGAADFLESRRPDVLEASAETVRELQEEA